MANPTPAQVAQARLKKAAEVADWQQVVLNGGPPCFHLEARGNFCLRAERWFGHHCDSPDHKFVSLAALVATAHAEGRQAALEEAEAAVGRVLVPTALARVTETLRQLATEARL